MGVLEEDTECWQTVSKTWRANLQKPRTCQCEVKSGARVSSRYLLPDLEGVKELGMRREAL